MEVIIDISERFPVYTIRSINDLLRIGTPVEVPIETRQRWVRAIAAYESVQAEMEDACKDASKEAEEE